MTHNRSGDVIGSDDESGDEWHDPRCRNGWLGEDSDGRPIPCLHRKCKPHLRQGTKDIKLLKPEWEK